MKFKIGYVLFAVLWLCFLSACATTTMESKTFLDTPLHHVYNGNTLLKAGKVDAAYREFNRAMELDPNYSPAYVGLSLIYGLRGDDASSVTYLKKAVDLLKENRHQLTTSPK
jgi:Tfp pilus assembly protein PilF